MRSWSIIILFFLLSVELIAQKGTISGRVYEAKTNNPLESASVIIQGTKTNTTSDSEGNFTFTGIEPGFKRLVVSSIGFEKTVSAEFQVQGNQTTYIDVAVLQTITQLAEITVTQRINFKRIESPLSLLKISVQDIEKGAGVNRDVSKAIQLLPGVGTTDPGRNDLIVRGGGPSENVFYLDGVEIPVINHFSTQGSSGGSVGVINPDFVREIDFYSGAFPANRGNALSSVIDIRQKDGSKDRIHSKLSVGASDAALTLDGPLGDKSTFILSARQSYLQYLFSAIGLPFLPTYTDFQVKNKFRLNAKNELTLIGIGAIDNMVLNTNIKNPSESQRYILAYLPVYKQWNYTIGTVYRHFAENYYDTWVLSRNMLNNTNFKYQDNNKNKPKISDYLSNEAENKLRYERSYPDLPMKILIGGGLNYASYSNHTYRKFYQNQKVYELNYSSNLTILGYQAFIQSSEEYFNNRLKLSLGISASGNNFNRNMRNPLNQFSPRLSASYTLSEKTTLSANVGRYCMQPSYTTLGFRNIDNELVNQNEKLRYILSNQALMGFEFRPTEKIFLSLEGFYKYYQHYTLSVADGISTASKGTEYGQVGDEEIVSTGKGRAYGIEFLFKMMEISNLNITSTFTLFKSEFTNAAGQYLPSSWDTKYLFNLMVGYKLQKSWNLATRWRLVGGVPYTPIDPVLSGKKNAWDIQNLPFLDFQKYNSFRLRPSHILDIRIDKELYFKKWLLNFYADIQNVYNFKSESTPIFTNLDKNGQPMTDPQDASRYLLRKIESLGGSILPTIGIIVKM